MEKINKIYIVKKALNFYLLCNLIALVWYFTIGGIIGFLTSDIPMVSFIVALLNFAFMCLITYKIVSKIFKNTILTANNIFIFFIPYIVLIICGVIALCYNVVGNSGIVYWLDTSIFKFIFVFLFPSSYSVLIIWGLFDFSTICYYFSIISFSLIHMLILLLFLKKQKKINTRKTVGNAVS